MVEVEWKPRESLAAAPLTLALDETKERSLTLKWSEVALTDPDFVNQFTVDRVCQRDHVLKPDELSPYDVYITLKEAFGNPNSLHFDDIKCQWQFALETPHAYVEVYDWKVLTWSIAVYLKPGAEKSPEKVGEEFLKVLVKQHLRHKIAIEKRLKNSDGVVIENPYIAYLETADSILELIAEVIDPKNCESEGKSLLGFDKWLKQYDLARAAFIMYLASVEGFLNLIYELYLRKELREKRIYERLAREQVDLKLRLAPVYCDCFDAGVIDFEAVQFKEYHSLANLRNDLVHANVTKPMLNPLVYEDGFEFVIDVASESKIGIPNNFRDFDYSHACLAKSITQNVVKYVIKAMSPRFRREFEHILELEYIKVEYEDGQVFVTSSH
jgi:hypothetical protein